MTPQLLDGLLLPSDESEKLLPLCLDEVGETSADTQLLLLRTLEERMTRLQGPNQSDPSMHILSMTNRVLIDEVEAGRFRSDLFYRLSTVILTIPPLCTRGQDVLLIAEHFNRKISIESGRALLIMGAEVQEALLAHSWPGNVRELRNLLSRLHGLAKSRTITLSDLPSDILVPRNRTANHSLSNDQRMAGAVSLKHAEVLLIENALNHHQGNLSKSAIALGISRPTLYRKIQNYGIKS
jgi:DNA-binding NtrC family response regulator